MKDVVIIGAGPAGLACAIEAGLRKLDYAVVEKGCLTNSINNFPVDMTFFSTPDLLEIGNAPFASLNFRPSRRETLNYYRTVSERHDLNVNCYEEVVDIKRKDNAFTISVKRLNVLEKSYYAKNIIISTGYFDIPKKLNIKGEESPKVSHYYTEGHQYYKMDVAVLGANNSSVEAALDLYRHGANTTLVHRGNDLGKKVKYWIAPELEKRINDGSINAFFNSELAEIRPNSIVINNNDSGAVEIKNDFLFALVGYMPDTNLLEKCGIRFNPDSLEPEFSEESYESNIKGAYLAGSIIGGRQTGKIFIETGRFHGKKIIEHILKERKQ